MNLLKLCIISIACMMTIEGNAQTESTPNDTPADSNSNTQGAEVAPPSREAYPQNQTCVPSCRSGFVCNAGICVSSCNPPCGEGYTCTAESQCIPQHPIQTAPVYTAPTLSPRAQLKEEARANKLTIREKRRVEAQKFRLGVHMDWQWAFSENAYRTGFMGNLGFQKNVARTFALRARVGGMLGYARPDFFDGERTPCWGANVDVAPLFGPLGSFYIGPAFWFTYYWHKDNWVEEGYYTFNDYDDYGADMVEIPDSAAGGIALDMGILIGDEANLGINWRLKSSIWGEELNFSFEFGLAYHFPIGE